MSSSSADPSSPPAANVTLIMAAVMSVLLMSSLGQTIITPALPIIVGDLGGLEHISWAITAYLLAATVAAPNYGKLGDMFGRKIVLQCGIAIFLLGSLLAAISVNMTMLVFGRFVQGLGAGGLIVTAMAVVGDVLPPRQRGKAQGIIGAAFGLSTIIGPLLGGVIVENFSWPWLFAINLPFGLLALGVIAVAFKGKPERVTRRIDYAGALLLTIFLSALVLYTSVGGTILPWTAPEALALPVISAVALVGFILVEQRAEEPVLPLYLFRNNAFLVVNSVGFLVGCVMFGSVTFVPFFLQVVKGFTPTQAGLGLIPMMLGLILASTLAGWFMSATGRYKVLPPFSTALLALGAVMLTTIGRGTPFWLTSLYLLMVGIGIGPIMSVSITVLQNSVPRSALGVGTASANMFRQVGGSIGVAVLGAIFANRLAFEMSNMGDGFAAFDVMAIAALPPETHDLVVAGYAEAVHAVFWFAAIAAALAFVLSWFLREVPLSDTLDASKAAAAAE